MLEKFKSMFKRKGKEPSGPPEDLFVAAVIEAEEDWKNAYGGYCPVPERLDAAEDGWQALELEPPAGVRTWVSTYANEHGKGFIVRQERIGAGGRFERRCLHVGKDPTVFSREWSLK